VAETIIAQRELVTIMKDQNDPDMMKRNKIHTADGGSAYGFRGALIGGVTLYGWCIPTILDAMGEDWLDRGWIYIQFRRPTYPDERIRFRVTRDDEGVTRFTATKIEADGSEGEVALRGELGMGEAAWLGDLQLSQRRTADPVLEQKEWLTLDNAPVGQDIRTLGYHVSVEDARQTGNEQIEPMELYTGEQPLVHPSVVARQMITLLAHSYDYGNPSIHASSHIQHFKRPYAGQDFVLTGHMVDAYEKGGHYYSVVDGNLLDASGEEVARIRHTNIFKVAKRE
jgi:hypothetical protein